MLRIQNICKAQGITLQELAARLGVTYQSLYESIKGNPTLKRLQEIATALNVEVPELFAPSCPSFVCPHCGKAIDVTLQAGKVDGEE